MAPLLLIALHRRGGGSWDQLAGVENSRGVERRLDRPQHLHTERADLVAHPAPMIGADGVVVGDGRTGGDYRVARCGLGGAPLLDRVTALPGDDGEVKRG